MCNSREDGILIPTRLRIQPPVIAHGCLGHFMRESICDYTQKFHTDDINESSLLVWSSIFTAAILASSNNRNFLHKNINHFATERKFIVWNTNMAAMMSCENTLS